MLSTGFWMLIFFSNLCFIEFRVRYLALFCLFWVIGGFKWFSMGNLHNNIQLMLEFLRFPFLVLYFSYYTLMTVLMMLSVISRAYFRKRGQGPTHWKGHYIFNLRCPLGGLGGTARWNLQKKFEISTILNAQEMHFPSYQGD